MGESDGKVVYLQNNTKLDIPAERVLDAAREHGLKTVVLIGCDADGEEYFASSYGAIEDTSWLIRRADHYLMRMADETDE